MRTSRRKIATILSILCLFVIFLVVVQYAGIEDSSTKAMRNYAQTLINAYINASTQFFPSLQNNLTFQPNTAYSIDYYSSSQGGRALLIEPSNAQTFQKISSSEDIQTAVFNGNLSIGGVFEGWVHRLLLSSLSMVNWGDRSVIHLLNDSDAVVKNCSITRTTTTQYYYYVSIKTSNETNHWTPENATDEAIWILGFDTGEDFFNSADFNRLVVIPEITSLLKDMKEQANNASYLASTQYLADLERIKDIATQYGISSEILNQLIQFVNAQTTGQLPAFSPDFLNPPASNSTTETTFRILLWKFNDPTGGWMFIGFICLFSMLSLVFYLIFDGTKDKSPSRLARGLFQLPFWAASLIVITLVTTPQENWQPSIMQGIAILTTVVVIAIAAFFLLRKYKRESSVASSSTAFRNKTIGKGKGNSHKQPKHGFKTK